MFDGRKRNPFSQEFHDDLRALQDAVDEIRSGGGTDAHIIGRFRRLPFRIDSSTISSSYPIWKYTLVQVKPKSSTGTDDDWEDVSGGINTGAVALNDLEAGNSPTTAYGYAVTYTGGAWKLSTAPFTECVFGPAPDDAVVWPTVVIRPDGTIRYSFSAPNTITPGCEEE